MARGGKTYGSTAGGSYRRGPRRYVSDAVSHDDRCIVLQNFERTIYFCKIMIEKIYKKFRVLLREPWGNPSFRLLPVPAGDPHHLHPASRRLQPYVVTPTTRLHYPVLRQAVSSPAAGHFLTTVRLWATH
jgi:hypothetical protein